MVTVDTILLLLAFLFLIVAGLPIDKREHGFQWYAAALIVLSVLV